MELEEYTGCLILPCFFWTKIKKRNSNCSADHKVRITHQHLMLTWKRQTATTKSFFLLLLLLLFGSKTITYSQDSKHYTSFLLLGLWLLSGIMTDKVHRLLSFQCQLCSSCEGRFSFSCCLKTLDFMQKHWICLQLHTIVMWDIRISCRDQTRLIYELEMAPT